MEIHKIRRAVMAANSKFRCLRQALHGQRFSSDHGEEVLGARIRSLRVRFPLDAQGGEATHEVRGQRSAREGVIDPPKLT
jgi:hypothetical protein